MRSKDETKYELISNAIKKFVIDRGYIPTQREIAEKLGMSRAGVYKYLAAMREKGIVEGSGRHIFTAETKLIPVPIVNSLANHLHVYDSANIQDFIFISKQAFGEGEFGIVKVVDNSMLNAGLKIDNYVVVRRQIHAKNGQIVLAKSNEKYILRRYHYDEKTQTARLEMESTEKNEVIYDFDIRGTALTIIAEI